MVRDHFSLIAQVTNVILDRDLDAMLHVAFLCCPQRYVLMVVRKVGVPVRALHPGEDRPVTTVKVPYRSVVYTRQPNSLVVLCLSTVSYALITMGRECQSLATLNHF